MHSGGFCEKSFFALSRLYFDHRFSLGNSRERTLWVNHLHFHSSIHLVIDFSTQKSDQATVNHQRVSESLYSITWKISETVFSLLIYQYIASAMKLRDWKELVFLILVETRWSTHKTKIGTFDRGHVAVGQPDLHSPGPWSSRGPRPSVVKLRPHGRCRAVWYSGTVLAPLMAFQFPLSHSGANSMSRIRGKPLVVSGRAGTSAAEALLLKEGA